MLQNLSSLIIQLIIILSLIKCDLCKNSQNFLFLNHCSIARYYTTLFCSQIVHSVNQFQIRFSKFGSQDTWISFKCEKIRFVFHSIVFAGFLLLFLCYLRQVTFKIIGLPNTFSLQQLCLPLEDFKVFYNRKRDF